MYRYEDIRRVHLEITEKCQARCVMCARTDEDGNFNPNLKNSELSLEDCKHIFPPEFVRQLEHIYMCGNYGDAIFARDTLAVFEYFRDNNFKMRLSLNTNGGGKPKAWWKDLAHLLTPGKVVFAIDGLEDTNHLYREGVNWKLVMQSVEAFISEGGNAEWHYLVFKHNEHQVEEARELSKKLGFKDFVIKKSSRFKGDRKTYKHLEIPSNPKYVNESVGFLDLVKSKYGNYANFLDSTPISCRVKKESGLYISAVGHVLPCCWLGHDISRPTLTSPAQSQMIQLADFNVDNLDAKKSSIKGVFDTGIFEEIEKSWGLPSVKAGKLATCSSTCSANHDFFELQFKD
jgi:MoaA/NifB/PqqE/SkfB family radical SAM enzyme